MLKFKLNSFIEKDSGLSEVLLRKPQNDPKTVLKDVTQTVG